MIWLNYVLFYYKKDQIQQSDQRKFKRKLKEFKWSYSFDFHLYIIISRSIAKIEYF